MTDTERKEMTAAEIYEGSSGEATKKFYAQLQTFGPVGIIAMNLFRAQKASARAKVYRGGVRGVGSFKNMAYEKKQWSMANLCLALNEHAQSLNICWGWKEDPDVPLHGNESSWVLYVDLPAVGQVSFHAPKRIIGPDYSGEWDRSHQSAERIIEFCNSILGTRRQLAL